MASAKNYKTLSRPYDSFLTRDTSTNAPTTLANTQSSGQAGTESVSGGAGGSGSGGGVSGSTGGVSGDTNGSVETSVVKSDGGLSDVWIRTFIRSENWKPKSYGFTIDGRTGYAEFTNVFVSGRVQAYSGLIGGFTIGDTTLSVTSGGNKTIVSSGTTAFSAGPTGSPSFTVTRAGVLTATLANITGYINASSGNIGGWVIENTYLRSTNSRVGISSNDTVQDDISFWAGHTNPESAPFSITESGALRAESGVIGGFAITNQELYGGIIKTAESVGTYGTSGVILDRAGIRGYSASLGQVFNVPTDGTAPTFSSGVIWQSNMESSNIASTTINGGIITAKLVRTAAEGRRIEMNSSGIQAINGALGVPYGDEGDNEYKYWAEGGAHTRFYGTGVLVYINNNDVEIPFYVNQEQAVADLHLYNRNAWPTGRAEFGDIAVIANKLAICVSPGEPGVWESVGVATGLTVGSASPSASKSVSPSISPPNSYSPSVSSSRSPSISPPHSYSPSVSSSRSPSTSPSMSPPA